MEGIAAHKTYREMAREESVDLATIARDVKVIRRYWQLRMATDYDTLVREEREILEALHRAVMPVALSGGKNGTPSMFAVDRVITIRERLARLVGLDAPMRTDTKVTVEHTTTLDAEIERLMVAMTDDHTDV
jgi:hypothetical protein